MNEVIEEWIAKAEGDFTVAMREWRARKNRSLDGVCFHAQQCVEKYLKGLMQSEGIHFDKTHDLVVLVKACVPNHPMWATWQDDLKVLSRFAVLFRYPGESATRDDALRSVRIMRKYRGDLREALGLDQ